MEGGRDKPRFNRFPTNCIQAGQLPFASGLGLNAFVPFQKAGGTAVGFMRAGFDLHAGEEDGEMAEKVEHVLQETRMPAARRRDRRDDRAGYRAGKRAKTQRAFMR